VQRRQQEECTTRDVARQEKIRLALSLAQVPKNGVAPCVPSFKQAPPPIPKQPTKEEVRKYKFLSFKNSNKPLEFSIIPPFSPEQPIVQEVCKHNFFSFKNPNQPLETPMQPLVPSSISSMFEILNFAGLYPSQKPILVEAQPFTPIEKFQGRNEEVVVVRPSCAQNNECLSLL
jgi:hypothetical protein